MEYTKPLEKIKYKLLHINQLFIDKGTIDKIFSLVESNYDIKHLIKIGYLSIIKKNTIYVNKLYPQLPSSEAIVGMYCKWDVYMIWWLSIYNQYGFTTQQAQITTVYTTKSIWEKVISWQRFFFYKKRRSFFWGKERKEKQSISYYIMNRERALVQNIIDNNGILEFANDIRNQIIHWKIDIWKLQEYYKNNLSKKEKELLAPYLEIWYKN